MQLEQRNNCRTYNYSHHSAGGFSLVELVIGVFLFAVLGAGIYQGYAQVADIARLSRLKVTASALANEQFEIVRNLPYADVGISGSIPSGVLTADKTLVRDNVSFDVLTTVRNIDDPFDGTIGGNPNDLSPADYKLVEVVITCPTCKQFSAMSFSTNVAPKDLESASTNGALFIQVLDANGQSVAAADVHIENNLEVPPIVIDDTTNVAGLLTIVDAPPGIEAYEITVTKPGYSEETTYPTGAPENPNPSKPHATVLLQQVTQVTFSIDRTSALEVLSVRDTCSTVGSIDFTLAGTRVIGTNPDILKYDENHITNAGGMKSIIDLEWDTYGTMLIDGVYDLIGTIPLIPLGLSPNTVQDFKLIVAPQDPGTLLVTVKDAATLLPLSESSVRLEGAGYDETLLTGRGFLRQTDWSGGGGQVDFLDASRYFDSDGTVEDAGPAGELRLETILGEYASAGSLTSSSFDTGSASNFYDIDWQPEDQPPETGVDAVRFQIATNTDNATWNFLGPDGTGSTYYTLADQNIHGGHNGDRYFRYKAFLQTASTTFTPNISDVAATFTSLCVPPGQVAFSGLSSAGYTLTVSKAGYQPWSEAITINLPWQESTIVLAP